MGEISIYIKVYGKTLKTGTTATNLRHGSLALSNVQCREEETLTVQDMNCLDCGSTEGEFPLYGPDDELEGYLCLDCQNAEEEASGVYGCLDEELDG